MVHGMLTVMTAKNASVLNGHAIMHPSLFHFGIEGFFKEMRSHRVSKLLGSWLIVLLLLV